MSKYSLVKLMESDLDTGGGVSKLREKRILKLYPGNKSLEEIADELENAENYGMYISNLRNTNDFVKKGFLEKFGKPSQRRTLTRGGEVIGTPTAASYTAADVEKYIGTLLNSLPNDKTRITLLRRILNWDPNNDKTYLIFPFDGKTNTIDVITKKINYILGKAGMKEGEDYEISLEKEL
jgi:hypothetical protein